MRGLRRAVVGALGLVLLTLGSVLALALLGSGVAAAAAVCGAQPPAGETAVASYAALQSDLSALVAGDSATYALTASLSSAPQTATEDEGLVIPVGANVTLDLNGCTLTITDPGVDATGAGYAAIEVPPGASLTIDDTSSTTLEDQGSVTADGSSAAGSISGGGAGIGGDGGDGGVDTSAPGESAGTIIIEAGGVEAQGGGSQNGGAGAGIGGGGGATESGADLGSPGGDGGDVTVSAGALGATAGSTSVPGVYPSEYGGGGGGAAVGGGGGGEYGGGGDGGEVTVSGGEVQDVFGGDGGDGGAAIGGGGGGLSGSGGSGSDFTLSSGNVENLYGGWAADGSGAGVGGGGGDSDDQPGGSGGMVAVSGGLLDNPEGGPASHGGSGAGIGGGGAGGAAAGGAGAQVDLSGGEVEIPSGGGGGAASGGGAGVGGGGGIAAGGDGGTVTVAGGWLDGPYGGEGGNTGGIGDNSGGGGAGLGGGGSGADAVSGAGSAVTVEAGRLTGLSGGRGSTDGLGSTAGAGAGAGGAGSSGTTGAQGGLTFEGGQSDLSGEVAGALTVDEDAVVNVSEEDGDLSLDDPVEGASVNYGTIDLGAELGGTGYLTNDGAIVVSGGWAADGQGGDYGSPEATVTGNVFDLRFSVPQGLTAPPDLWVFAPTVAGSGEALPDPPADPGFTVGWTAEGEPFGTTVPLSSLANSSGLVPVNETQVALPATITATVSSLGRKSAFGWWPAPVTVTYSCHIPAGTTVTGGCPPPVTLGKNAPNQTVSETIHVSNGVSASTAVHGISIDTTHPKVRISGVKPGKVYADAPRAKCVASDAISGIGSCRLSVHRTKLRSEYAVTVKATATSRAGLSTTVHVKYVLERRG